MIPGDTFSMNPTVFCRMATPLHPVMENMYLDLQWFFVPSRLVWDNFKKFMGERDNPGDHNDYTIPQILHSGDGAEPDSIYDHMGIPTQNNGISHSALPLRCYNLIYNEWYRDTEIMPSAEVPTGDANDSPGTYQLLRRMKRHDYFTACRPDAQRGPEVILPLGGEVPVSGDITANPSLPPIFGSGSAADDYGTLRAEGSTHDVITLSDPGGSPGTYSDIYFGSTTGLTGDALVADLESAEGATINELRMAITIQQMYERDMRSGGRYPEILQGHFNVRIPDAQWRPEYLGGSTTRINVNPVPQTSSTDPSGPDASPQGNLAAFAEGYNTGPGFTKSFAEHGYVLGIASVRADLNYQDGLERFWSRETRFDFYWPTFSGLGEQEVKSREIYATGAAGDDNTFGFQERYAEYRYKPSKITGPMRSSHPETLDTWHLAQEFETRPQLNQAFMVEDPPIERIIAVEDEVEFLVDAFFRYRCTRPMPTYGTPGLRRL